MKLLLICFTALLVTFTVSAQTPQAIIKIIQDGKTYLPARKEIQLQRKPFVIEVTLQHIAGVYVKADFVDSMYQLKDNEPVPDLQILPGLAMAEEEFNKDKELLIKPRSWMYWFYDPAQDWHRFDKDVKMPNPNTVIGTKTVQQFYIVKAKQTVKVEDVKEPLYLFFLTTSDVGLKELKREKVKISWL